MKNNKFDEMIRRELRETAPKIPSTYDEKLDEILQNLPEKEVHVEKRFLPRVAVILLCFLLVGAPVTYAAVQKYLARLESIPKKEIKEINKKIQSAEVDADTYSRELTEQERTRMMDLRTQYEKKGKFPKGKILEVDKVADVDESKFCYCYENSTFYLPEEELTDEQLLQIIDLQYIRDYALIQSQESEKEETNTGKKGKVSKKEAKNFAAGFIELSYWFEPKKLKLVKTSTGRDGGKDKVYTFRDKKHHIDIDVNASKGMITWGQLTEQDVAVSGIKVDEEQYYYYVENVQRLAHNLLEERKKVLKLKFIKCSYSYLEDNTLATGEVKYYVVDEKNSGYVLFFNVKNRKITSFYSFDDYDEYREKEKKEDEYKEKTMGAKRKELDKTWYRVTKKDAIKTAIKFLNNAYQIKLKMNDFSVEKSWRHFELLCEEKNIEVGINEATGKIASVIFLDGESATGIKINEQEYINYVDEVRNLAKYFIEESQIEHIEANYSYREDGTLAAGIVYFQVIDKYDNGYDFVYNVKEKKIDAIMRCEGVIINKKIQKKQDKKYNEPEGIFRKYIDLDSVEN